MTPTDAEIEYLKFLGGIMKIIRKIRLELAYRLSVLAIRISPGNDTK